MSYNVSLESFEGPLDLLLHLIQKQKIDIYNIPIAEVTEQYLQYLQAMQEFDLEIACEFLLMAATLIAIKARMLLPRTTIHDEGIENEDEDIDPREELVNRLIEYQKFKDAAEQLKVKQAKQALFYTRPLGPTYLQSAFKKNNPLKDISLEDLIAVLTVVLTEVSQEDEVKEIKKTTVTVNEKISYLELLLSQEPQGLVFQNLFTDNTPAITVVVTFLALLEMVRLKKVLIVQTASFGPLRIFARLPQEEEVYVI